MNLKKFIALTITSAIIMANLIMPSNASSSEQSVDISGIKNFVTRLYDICLNREPDEEGLNGWANKLANKEATGCSVAYGFVFSPEFINLDSTNSEFVTYMYDAFFGRVPDTEGFNYWVDYLDRGATRESVFCGFANSIEFNNLCSKYGVVRGFHIEGYDFNQVGLVNLFVERLYDVILNRSCDMEGMAGWTTQLVTKTNTGCGVAYGFVFSPEFVNRNACNNCYVETLYQAFLGRASDEGGKLSWVSKLDSYYSRETVFNGFAGSPEFNNICATYGIDAGSLSSSGSTFTPSGKCSICGKEVNPSTPSATPSTTSSPTPATFEDATKYTYEIVPLYENYNRVVLVKTDNPDPSSFALLDKDTVYSDEKVYIKPLTIRFVDVDYENYSTGRFDGGYICWADGSDGGNLTVCQTVAKQYRNGTFLNSEETDLTITSCSLVDVSDLLINTCCDDSKSLWDNLRAVQSYLDKYSCYPLTLCDPDSKTSIDYLYLAAPSWQDQPVFVASSIYNSSSEDVLSLYAYPYILHSRSFPGVMARITRKLEPNATVEYDSFYHYLIIVTYEGETLGFGGAGNTGDNGLSSSINALLPKHITARFTTANSIPSSSWYKNLNDYWNSATYELADQVESISSSAIITSLPDDGAWNRIYGGYIYSSHSYATGSPDVWVDGRYCGTWFVWEQGATFEEHPTSSILITNMTYTNYKGDTLTGDVLYEYDSTHDCWIGTSAYGSAKANSYAYRVYSYEEILSNAPELILTQDEVKAMDVDRNTSIEPAHGIICDGTAYPGTPF